MTDQEKQWIERAMERTGGYGIIRMVIHGGRLSKVEATSKVREKEVDSAKKRRVDSGQT